MKEKVHYSTSNLNGKKNGASTIPENKNSSTFGKNTLENFEQFKNCTPP